MKQQLTCWLSNTQKTPRSLKFVLTFSMHIALYYNFNGLTCWCVYTGSSDTTDLEENTAKKVTSPIKNSEDNILLLQSVSEFQHGYCFFFYQIKDEYSFKCWLQHCLCWSEITERWLSYLSRVGSLHLSESVRVVVSPSFFPLISQ